MASENNIEPDNKNWTWVLDKPCPDCGYDAAQQDVDMTGIVLRDLVSQWQTLLLRTDVTERSVPSKWSILEYACHVRDVFRIFDMRLNLMLTQDDPLFENWDQDATAVEENSGAQNPSEVREQLTVAGRTLAAHFDDVSGDQWKRTGRRSDGASFTVESFALYLLHDPMHHVWDVQ